MKIRFKQWSVTSIDTGFAPGGYIRSDDRFRFPRMKRSRQRLIPLAMEFRSFDQIWRVVSNRRDFFPKMEESRRFIPDLFLGNASFASDKPLDSDPIPSRQV